MIHETRASASSKQYHVSKVYFYSVRDVLTEEESASAEKAEHVSILDCETGRVRKGYAQPAPTSPGEIIYPLNFFFKNAIKRET